MTHITNIFKPVDILHGQVVFEVLLVNLYTAKHDKYQNKLNQTIYIFA